MLNEKPKLDRFAVLEGSHVGVLEGRLKRKNALNIAELELVGFEHVSGDIEILQDDCDFLVNDDVFNSGHIDLVSEDRGINTDRRPLRFAVSQYVQDFSRICYQLRIEVIHHTV